MKIFFLSLKTTVWTLLGLIALFFFGAYMLPAHRPVFAPMNDGLLFDWAVDIGARYPWQAWWFFAAVAALMLLTVNTIVCSIQAIRGRWTRNDALLRISPQITHIGFLFILLGHLIGAGWGYRLSGGLPEGAYARLPEDRILFLQAIHVEPDARGHVANWSADAVLYEKERLIKAGTLGPNRPLFYQGMGIYLKSFELEPRPFAVLLVARDPGALWVFAGGMLFTAGSITLLVLKWKKA